MTHERTDDEGEVSLEPVGRVCLALPEATEVEAWGRPTFRAGPKKVFAISSGTGQAESGLVFRPSVDERDALLGPEATKLIVEWWTPGGGRRLVERD